MFKRWKMRYQAKRPDVAVGGRLTLPGRGLGVVVVCGHE
jgi:hypothetical protein